MNIWKDTWYVWTDGLETEFWAASGASGVWRTPTGLRNPWLSLCSKGEMSVMFDDVDIADTKVIGLQKAPGKYAPWNYDSIILSLEGPF